MKEYRVSLEVATSPTVTGPELASLLGVAPSALFEEQRRGSTLWRYEPSTGQTGTIAERVRQLALEVSPRRDLPRGGGSRRVSLGIDVRYDTAACIAIIPLYGLVYGRESLKASVPELSSIDLTCTVSDHSPILYGDYDAPREREPSWEQMRQLHERWVATGRPAGPRASSPLTLGRQRSERGGRGGRTHADEYIVSLDAITSGSVTLSEVADVLGVPPDSLYRQERIDDAVWTCEVAAGRAASLSEFIRFLVSEVHPRRSFPSDGSIGQIYLDVGVLYRVETCLVRLPVSSLVSLIRKLFVLDVEVRCYPDRPG